jgi:hypothetical protein
MTSGLLVLVERHGADEAARLWLEDLDRDQLMMLASPYVLLLARRLAAAGVHPAGEVTP